MRWLVVKTPPLSRNLTLLKTILTNRFPTIKFEYERFQTSLMKKKVSYQGMDGVIAVLKTFSENHVPLFDRLIKNFSKDEIIFVLSPKAYQILNLRRKKALHQSLFLMSEVKCLDYLATLPRFIEEVGLRSRLRRENEKLQRLFKQNWDGPLPAEFDSVEMDEYPKVERQVLVRLHNWKSVSRQLGDMAEVEFDQAILRLISSAIRGGDHVLRRKEDEYLVLLHDVEIAQLKKCMKRISSSLKGLQLHANERQVSVKFKLASLPDRARSAV